MISNLPKGLKYIFEVYRLVRYENYTRKQAVNKIATRHEKINPSTVRAACTREICIGTDRLDLYMKPGHEASFKDFLLNRFPQYENEIEEFFTYNFELKYSQKIDTRLRKASMYPSELLNELKRKLLIELQKSLDLWIDRDVPNDIKITLQEWIELIRDYYVE